MLTSGNSTSSHRHPINNGYSEGSNPIVFNGMWKALLRWRWLVIVLVGLTVFVIETVEHYPAGFDLYGSAFLPEILLFGVVFPLAAGVVLNILAHTKSKLVQAMLTLSGNTKGKEKQRVLIVENELLLGAAIESLLTREVDLDLVGLASSNEADLSKAIGRSRPQVVILDEATYPSNSLKLLNFFRKHPELRLVLVNATNSLVHIYDKRNISINNPDDLAEAIRR